MCAVYQRRGDPATTREKSCQCSMILTPGNCSVKMSRYGERDGERESATTHYGAHRRGERGSVGGGIDEPGVADEGIELRHGQPGHGVEDGRVAAEPRVLQQGLCIIGDE